MTKVETLLKAAMELPDDDREYLAYELHASLSWSEDDGEAFMAELRRRWTAITNGEVEMLDDDAADRFIGSDDD